MLTEFWLQKSSYHGVTCQHLKNGMENLWEFYVSTFPTPIQTDPIPIPFPRLALFSFPFPWDSYGNPMGILISIPMRTSSAHEIFSSHLLALLFVSYFLSDADLYLDQNSTTLTLMTNRLIDADKVANVR